jgi:hypothetical protein
MYMNGRAHPPAALPRGKRRPVPILKEAYRSGVEVLEKIRIFCLLWNVARSIAMKKIQSDPAITTSVDAMTRLLRRIFCSTN